MMIVLFTIRSFILNISKEIDGKNQKTLKIHLL